MLALSSVHENIELTGNFPSNQSHAHRQFALQEYNKAVALTVNEMTAGNCAQMEVTLTVCILFICLELFQDNYAIAINRLKYGLRILSNCYLSPPRRNLSSRIHRERKLTCSKRGLNQIFTRLIIQTIFLGNNISQRTSRVTEYQQITKVVFEHLRSTRVIR
jgi:hypothetical protein